MTAVVSVPAAEVISHRYAARSQHGDKVGHLLARTWSEDSRGLRPALCGMKRAKWRAVHLFTNAADYRECFDCSVAAGLAVRPPTPIIPAPRQRTGRARPLDVPTVRGRLLDPQLAAAALPERHRIFRGPNPFGFTFTGEAQAYFARSYDQRLPAPSFID